ncbi:MAG: 3-deoxy-8-phosphooctulonate synthase [Bacteroidia bacterium]|nr:MAG: 3-deoxy-8-phosphooctulonate synthase [Bacteroidia bacterium]
MEGVLAALPQLENHREGAFILLAGPCVVEGEEISLRTAEHLAGVCERLGLPFVFKSSYRKANRSRGDSFTGLGDELALRILQKVKQELGVPIVTDVHLPEECATAAEVADILQIPAFLCRQTDLLQAAGRTGRVVNIKKGQFLAPEAMRFAAEKVASTGNPAIMLTDRGTMFGYGDLVVDYRGIPTMQETGYPVVLDVTHSLQQPNQSCGVTGGRPELIEYLARLGVAGGVDGLFMETHPEPGQAKSDGSNMLALHLAEAMLGRLVRLHESMQEIYNI